MTSPQASTIEESMEEGEAAVTEKQNKIGKFASIEDFTKEALKEIVNATKEVNAFPQGTARDLYCSYPAYGRVVDQQSHRILGLISKVLKWQNVKGNIQRRQPDEQFEMLLECNDAILERVGSNLDELAGVKKNPQTIIVESRLNPAPSLAEIGKGAGSWNTKRTDANTNPVVTTARLITAKNIARPQTNFSVPVDNSSLTPFMPRLKEKPNSVKPLAVLPEYDDNGAVVSYLHPYEFELVKFTVPAHQLKPLTAQEPKDINATELVYVDTVEKLREAIEEIRPHKAIAVDVEHHSYRSFLGLTCLIQISTNEKDYIFDTLELREDLHELNLIFTDPSVVKVFHGADSDIEWLQRDLSLYVVNMFDTHQAAKTLSFARLSLAYLLKHYCDLDMDKTFQLADWRMRPLPQNLLDYARRDTHYLLYAYQRLTNDLLAAGNQSSKILMTVYQRCTEICKKRYQKPVVGPTTHLELCNKAKRVFDNRQLYALEQILQWRDDISRREDESNGYVLPNHMMLQIAESLPREMQGILACCNPIPPLVRQHLHILHQIVLRAREQPLVKPILETSSIFRDIATQRKVYNEKLHCTLDNTHDEEFRDDLPVLFRFENDEMIVTENPVVNATHSHAKISFFEKNLGREIEKPDLTKLLFPYQRFLAYLPFAEKEKREEAERMEALSKSRRLCPAAPELIKVKTEMDSDDVEENENTDDNLYKMPVREMLKRKHLECVAKKSAKAATREQLNTKHQKVDNPSENAKTSNSKKRRTVDLTSDNDNEPLTEVPPSSTQQQQHAQNIEQSKRKKFKRNNRFKRQKTQQASNNVVQANAATTSQEKITKNFDYKNANFKKFQGGAKRAQGTQVQQHRRGKNNANRGKDKKFNKLFTFSNVKGNKK